jgi:Yip1 domain
MDFAKLIERAKNICLSPQTEWPKIAEEQATTGSLFTGYAMILAAIPAICGFIGLSFVGMSLPVVGTVRLPVGSALANSIMGYVLGLGAIFVLSLIINALAPTFDGAKNPIAALKLAVYTYTPIWLFGVLTLYPALGILTLLAALYAVYLLYLGLPVLMKNPSDKSIGYVALIIVCAILLSIVVAAIVGLIGLGTGAAALGGMR